MFDFETIVLHKHMQFPCRQSGTSGGRPPTSSCGGTSGASRTPPHRARTQWSPSAPSACLEPAGIVWITKWTSWHTKWTSCHTCQIKKICTSPSKICPPRFTDLAGLFLANPRTLEESGNSLWQWMHINAHQMNNLWQWTCKAMPSHIKWLMHIAPELAVQNVAHDLSSQTSMNQMEGDKKYQCCSEKKSVENSSRNTNQAMTCLSAPHVLLFSTHCQKNHVPSPSHGCKMRQVTDDRW